jgi:hypothetical protein
VAIYKVLRLSEKRKDLGDLLVYGKNEAWGSLEDALNELGAHGWEVVTPIYGPVPMRHSPQIWLDSLVLLNKNITHLDDINRRIEKIKRLIKITREKETDVTLSDISKVIIRIDIKNLESDLKKLEAERQRLEKNG